MEDQERPIVERPERWREKGCDCVDCLREDELFNYIEHLEAERGHLENALEVCAARRWEAEEEVGRLTEAIREKDKRMERIEEEAERGREPRGASKM